MFELIGMLIPTFLVSRLFIFLLGKAHLKQSLFVVAHFLSWLVSSFIRAWGVLDEHDSFLFYLIESMVLIAIPQIIWLLVDAIRNKSDMLGLRNRKFTVIFSGAILAILAMLVSYYFYINKKAGDDVYHASVFIGFQDMRSEIIVGACEAEGVFLGKEYIDTFNKVNLEAKSMAVDILHHYDMSVHDVRDGYGGLVSVSGIVYLIDLYINKWDLGSYQEFCEFLGNPENRDVVINDFISFEKRFPKSYNYIYEVVYGEI